MYSDLMVGLLIAAVFIWLGILTFYVLRGRTFLKSLFPSSGERDIRKKFEELLKEVEGFDNGLKDFEQRLGLIEEEGLLHLKKVNLLRYNPYNDTGGDQSFTVALLNDSGDGLVITSLHARSGTRVFAKPVKGGKPEKYDFSKEEQDVVSGAMKF